MTYIASRKHRLIYFNIPKSACTTVKNIMYFLDSGAWYHTPTKIHLESDVLMKSMHEKTEFKKLVKTRDNFVFTFIRQPDRRLYSCFTEKIHSEIPDYVRVRERIAREFRLRFDRNPQDDVKNHRKNFLAFIEFVAKNLASDESVRGRGHWQRQSTLIEDGHHPVQFIGLVESIKEHMNYVLKQAGLEEVLDSIPRFNEFDDKTVKFDAINDEEVKAAIYNTFKVDFDLYKSVAENTKHIN